MQASSDIADTPRRADVRDMAIVHQAYRREFVLAPLIVRGLREDEPERRAAALEWFDSMLHSMHHHHVAEDALLYPLLAGRVSQQLLDHMEHQHQLVERAVDTVQARLADWQQGLPESAEALALAHEALTATVVPHLDDEERDIVPLIGNHLSAAEYGRMATSGNEQAPRTLMMAFGAMIEQCSPDDAEFMLSHLPPHVRAEWDDRGAAQYREWMRLLRGDLVPDPPSSYAPVPSDPERTSATGERA